jgi:hypothetical protein
MIVRSFTSDILGGKTSYPLYLDFGPRGLPAVNLKLLPSPQFRVPDPVAIEWISGDSTRQLSGPDPVTIEWGSVDPSPQVILPPVTDAGFDRFDLALREVIPDLSDEERAAADRAVADARRTLEGFPYDKAPMIWVSDDGVAAVQWERPPSGVLLVFTGNGRFTASIRDGDRRRYTNGVREYLVSKVFPQELAEAILDLR